MSDADKGRELAEHLASDKARAKSLLELVRATEETTSEAAEARVVPRRRHRRALEFFVDLGLVLQGEGSVEGRWVDRVVGLEGVRVDYAMVQTPDGNGRLELVKFYSPSNQGDNRHAPANTPGIRHIAFAVEDIDAVVAGLRARGVTAEARA